MSALMVAQDATSRTPDTAIAVRLGSGGGSVPRAIPRPTAACAIPRTATATPSSPNTSKNANDDGTTGLLASVTHGAIGRKEGKCLSGVPTWREVLWDPTLGLMRP